MLGIVLGVIAQTIPIVQPTPPASTEFCAYIDRWRGTNVPISPATPATDIVRAAAIAIDGRLVGWFIVRRDGQAWYFDGPVRGPVPLRSDSIKALQNLGISRFPSNIGQGAFIQLHHTVDFAKLLRDGLGVYSCY